MNAFGKGVLFFILYVSAVIIGAFTLSKLWLWFVVPVFSVPQFTLVQAIGIRMFLGFVTAYDNGKRDTDALKNGDKLYFDTMVSMLSIGVFYPLITLMIAWGFHTLFM